MIAAHQRILETRKIPWPDEAACAAFASGLAAKPALRDACIALSGPLGAGKTTFVRHLLRALGAQGRIKSPSFALMEPYELQGIHVSHMDFYRFADAHELADAGLRDVFATPGLKLVEWPEHAAGQMPEPDLTIRIGIDDEASRSVELQAHSARGADLLA